MSKTSFHGRVETTITAEKDTGFNTFTAKGFSGTSPVMHLRKHIFQSQ